MVWSVLFGRIGIVGFKNSDPKRFFFIKNNLVKQILVKKSVSGSDLEKVVNCPQAENLEIYNVTTKDNHKS